MRKLWIPMWILGSILPGVVGWMLGELFGSPMLKIMFTAAFAGGTYGLLSKNSVLASAAFAAGAAGSLLGFQGQHFVSFLLAWPIAGLAIGLAQGFFLPGRAPKVVCLAAGLILGAFGFLFGSLSLGAVGWFTDLGWILGEFMRGGAVGFTLAVVCGLRLVAILIERRIDQGSAFHEE